MDGRRARHGRRLTQRAEPRAGAMAKRITVLLSGRGTNFAAMLAAMGNVVLGGATMAASLVIGLLIDL